MVTLAEAVRQRRQALGLSQTELADAAGVTRSWLAQVETGGIPDPGTDRLMKLAGVLGVPFMDLLEPDQRASIALSAEVTRARQAADDLIRALTAIAPPPPEELAAMQAAVTEAASAWIDGRQAADSRHDVSDLARMVIDALRRLDRPWAAAALLASDSALPDPPTPPRSTTTPKPTLAAMSLCPSGML
jgi:transcriptional regulator with XRE-family HTH domain